MKTITTTPRYNSAFWNFQRGRVHDAADLRNVRNEEAIGYFLPNESESLFRAEAEKMNVFRRIGKVIFTETGDKKIKIVPPSGAAAFVSEGGAIPEGDAGIVSYTVFAHKIAKITKVSTELVNDAGFDLESALAADFGREFGKTEEDACINGSGTSRPYGILHPTDGAETGVTATGSLGFDDVKALYFSLGAEYRRNAVWLMSEETALSLRTLKDSAGAYIWCDSDDTILGKPVYTSPYMPGTGAGNKPVLFGDFSFYWLMERGGVALKPLREKYAAQGATGFIGTEYIDGRLIRREAIKAMTMV